MPRTVDQSELVGRRGIIDDVILTFFRLLRVSDHCVAQAQGFKETLDLTVVGMTHVLELLVHLLVVEVYIGHAGGILNIARFIDSEFILTS